jgi:hypothetical protein
MATTTLTMTEPLAKFTSPAIDTKSPPSNGLNGHTNGYINGDAKSKKSPSNWNLDNAGRFKDYPGGMCTFIF